MPKSRVGKPIPSILNGTMFGDLDWPINASYRFVSISWASCYPRDVESAVYATATWLCGWVSVTRRYCIKTAKPIIKLFRLSGSAVILVSSDPCADNQFQSETIHNLLNDTTLNDL